MLGTRLSNRYELVSELGRGGMGVVYRARDPLLNREVAIKLIPPGLLSSDSEQRFQREAQLVAQMDHPAIVSIYDIGRHEDALFFVMPIVQGTNLRHFLRERSLVQRDVIDIGVQVSEALDYSHNQGIFHRDIKPENIMVSREEGGRARVRIMDFGLARASSENRLTKTGTLIGTMAYLSPEQVLSRPSDHRTDIYSLGTVLYECLIGDTPFSGEIQSILYRIVHEIPQSPRSLGAEIDEEIEGVLMSCLEKDPARRPQRALEIAHALGRYQLRMHASDMLKSVALTRPMSALRPALAPFVGRTKELAELQQRLNAAITGECQFLVLAGEPGIGKTRLLDEFENLARARKILVLHGRYVEQGTAFPYQGFCEMIQEYFRSREAGFSSTGLPDIADLAQDLVALFPMLSEVADIRSSAAAELRAPGYAELQGPEKRTYIFELLARTITRLAAGRPLILILEELHGAEASLEAMQYIVRRLGATPTLIIGTYRTTEVDARHPLLRMLAGFRGDRRFLTLTLGPLSASEHQQFLETLIGGPQISSDLIGQIYEGTEGNPFFIKELVRSLLDAGGIAKDATGSWSLVAEKGLDVESLPATIQQAVEKRIERLPEELREVLSIAAVIGRTFDYRDLEALAAERKDMEEAIERLVQEGLIEEERESRGDRLTFCNGVIRDVLYGALSRRRRRSLHRKYAEQLEERHKGRLERAYSPLMYHYSQGDVPEKSVEYGLLQARAALGTFSPDEALRSARTALEFLDEEWEGNRSMEGEARLLLAEAQRMAGNLEAAAKESEAAIGIFSREGNSSGSLRSLVFAADTCWQARQTEDASRWTERGIPAARESSDKESLHHLLNLAATLANLRGEYVKANNYLAEAVRLDAGKAGEAAPQAEIQSGGKLVVALAIRLQAREPATIRVDEEGEVLSNVFETLLTTDSDGNLIANLCEKWEVRDGGRSFVLRLKPEAHFDDGRPLTAAEVKISFERAIRQSFPELPAPYAPISGAREFGENRSDNVAGIVVHSDTELEIRLREALPIYPSLLTDYHAGIAGVAHHPEGTGQALAGTGPFRMVSFGSERIVLERNPRYWRGRTSLVDGIEFCHGMNPLAIAQGLRKGEIDLARDMTPKDLEELLRDPRFRSGLVETPKRNTYFVLFNARTGPCAQNAQVRRALAGILRTRNLVWRTLGRFAQPALSLIPPGMLGHDPGRRHFPLTREEAQEMLAGSQAAQPIQLKALIHPLFEDRYGALLESLLANWSELGVQVSTITSTMGAYLESHQDMEALDLFIGRWVPDYGDPDIFTYSLFHSEVGLFRNFFSSPESDQLLEEARSEGRSDVREGLYRRFENLLLERAIVAPLFHDIDYRLASPKIHGLQLTSVAPYVNYAAAGKIESAETVSEALRPAGGVLHIPIQGIVHRLDPALSQTVEEDEILPVIFETLTRDVGGRIVPWLASEMTVEENGRKYRFRLREDVRFHDGRRLTARDVRYSFERLLQNPESKGRWFYSVVRGAQALLDGEAGDLAGFRIVSASEFTIELEDPVAFFPALLTYIGSGILPEGSDQQGRSWQEGLIGTGPFRVTQFEPGGRLELERHKTYWRRGFPKTEGLVFQFGLAPKEILSEFRAGRLSLASDLYPPDAELLRREPEFAAGYRECPRLITYFLAFNIHRGPLSDRRLRQSLASAVDVASLVRTTMGRWAIPAQGLIPPGLPGHDPSSAFRSPSVSSAGHDTPTGELELMAALHPVFQGEYSALIRELSNLFRQQRVRLKSVTQTIVEFLQATADATVDLRIGRWAADYPDADSFAYQLHSKGNVGRMCGTPEMDRLIERGRTEWDPAVRHSIYREVESLAARELLILPLFHEQSYRFARPEVEGLTVSYASPVVDYANLRLRN